MRPVKPESGRKPAHRLGQSPSAASRPIVSVTCESAPSTPVSASTTFLIRLAKGVPKSHVYRIVRSGEVRVNRGRVAADYRVQPGDDIRVPPLRTAQPAGGTHAAAVAPALMPPILYEDDDLVVDRQAGRRRRSWRQR